MDIGDARPTPRVEQIDQTTKQSLEAVGEVRIESFVMLLRTKYGVSCVIESASRQSWNAQLTEATAASQANMSNTRN